MKKLLLLLIGFIFIVFGCSKADEPKPTPTFPFYIKNESSVTVTAKWGPDSYTIKAGETINLTSEYKTGKNVLATASNGWYTDVEKVMVGEVENYIITIFENLVEYKVLGTAKTIDLTFHNDSDGTSQLTAKTVPWNIGYKTFKGTFVYVSAQNQGETGTVIAQVFFRGKKVFESTSEGKYVIAKASGSIKN
jgi:plastocyanin